MKPNVNYEDAAYRTTKCVLRDGMYHQARTAGHESDYETLCHRSIASGVKSSAF
jgi:hypothetical protein